MRRFVFALLVTAVACGGDRTNAPYSNLPTPTGLTYQLVPSGIPDSPDGVLLSWDDVADANTTAYVVYSRNAASGSWSRRAETTSPTFHDAGLPAHSYYVATRDEAGHLSSPSYSVTIDVRLHLPAPASLNSITLYRAVQLSWSSNSRTADPHAFDYYRVYSTVWSAAASRCDDSLWILEGTTISEDFISTGLTNGVRYCFAVSAVSRDGHESLFSVPRDDTPRYDSRNVILDAFQVAPATSGFDFYNPTANPRFGIVSSGSASGIDAPMDVVFELVDQGVSSNTPATILYDSATVGVVAITPATCMFVAANATQMFGSVGSVRVTRPGSIWVTSTLPSGGRQTRLMGNPGEGIDCLTQYGTAAKLTFLPGRVPVAGERVTVQYRGQRRSVARLANTANMATEALSGSSGTSRWLGKVLQPATRSSVDCESAAAALLAFSTSRTAAVAGTYVAVNPDDVWPGDLLSVTSAGVTSALLVRSVDIEDGGAVPEVRRYRIVFANDWATEWADGLGLRLSDQVAADAVLPDVALGAPGEVLANLQQLVVTSLTATVLNIDTGVAAPVGGGFEVRRRDWAFGTGSSNDLVLRSPVRNFSIPRMAQMEHFFVRMYDASAVPVYSRFSSAVFVNVPVT